MNKLHYGFNGVPVCKTKGRNLEIDNQFYNCDYCRLWFQRGGMTYEEFMSRVTHFDPILCGQIPKRGIDTALLKTRRREMVTCQKCKKKMVDGT